MHFPKGQFPAYLSVITALAISLAAHSPADAQNTNGFYPRNSALTVFERGVTLSDPAKIQILKEKKEEPVEASTAAEIQVPQPSPQVQTAQPPQEHPLSSEGIVAKYGDPEKDAPIVAQDNAPTPFKGMMAALQADDEKLAFAYARQYVRHLRNLQEVSNRAMFIQGKAMQKEGMLGEGAWVDSQQYAALEAVYEDVINEGDPQTKKSALVNLNNMDPRVRAVLNKAFTAEESKRSPVQERPNSELNFEQMFPEEELKAKPKVQHESPEILMKRAEARQSFAGRVPIDPKGEVELYVFIRALDQKSQLLGKEVQAYYEQLPGNSKVKVRGLTLELEDLSSVAGFRTRTGATFPIANGGVFAKQAGIKSIPAIMAVAKNTGKAVIETGQRKTWYLEELVRYMQGGK